MKYLIGVFLALIAAPASAVTLITDNTDVFAIGPGDSFDHVVMFDSSNVTMSGGAITGHFLMLDAALATFTGGSIGNLTVLGDAVATVVIQLGSLEIDAVPTPEPVVLTQATCPDCLISATLANGDLVGPVPAAALQLGRIKIEAIPEPFTASLLMLGLLGLGWMSRLEGR